MCVSHTALHTYNTATTTNPLNPLPTTPIPKHSYGAIVGAIALTLGTEFVKIPGITRPVLFGAILVIVLLVRDRGIFARIPLRLGATRSGASSPDAAGGVPG